MNVLRKDILWDMEKAEPGSHFERPTMYDGNERKLMERLICRKLEALLGKEGLSECQFYFRKVHSTIDALDMIKTIA